MTLARKVAPIPAMSQHRRDTELEQWICERLKLRDLFAGDTTTEIRRDRLRLVLSSAGSPNPLQAPRRQARQVARASQTTLRRRPRLTTRETQR
jgi:hypothetical protein